MAIILQPTDLTDFYKNGFNTPERNSAMKRNHQDRFIRTALFFQIREKVGKRGLEDGTPRF